MPSWRDTVSDETQDAMDGLFGAASDFAEKLLAKRGGFLPFAIVLYSTGEQTLAMAASDPKTDDGQELLRDVQDGLRTQKDDLLAYALAVDVRVPSLNSDAIEVRIEHSDGTALSVIVPYKVKRFRRGVELGAMQTNTDGAHHLLW